MQELAARAEQILRVFENTKEILSPEQHDKIDIDIRICIRVSKGRRRELIYPHLQEIGNGSYDFLTLDLKSKLARPLSFTSSTLKGLLKAAIYFEFIAKKYKIALG